MPTPPAATTNPTTPSTTTPVDPAQAPTQPASTAPTPPTSNPQPLNKKKKLSNTVNYGQLNPLQSLLVQTKDHSSYATHGLYNLNNQNNNGSSVYNETGPYYAVVLAVLPQGTLPPSGSVASSIRSKYGLTGNIKYPKLIKARILERFHSILPFPNPTFANKGATTIAPPSNLNPNGKLNVSPPTNTTQLSGTTVPVSTAWNIQTNSVITAFIPNNKQNGPVLVIWPGIPTTPDSNGLASRDAVNARVPDSLANFGAVVVASAVNTPIANINTQITNLFNGKYTITERYAMGFSGGGSGLNQYFGNSTDVKKLFYVDAVPPSFGTNTQAAKNIENVFNLSNWGDQYADIKINIAAFDVFIKANGGSSQQLNIGHYSFVSAVFDSIAANPANPTIMNAQAGSPQQPTPIANQTPPPTVTPAPPAGSPPTNTSNPNTSNTQTFSFTEEEINTINAVVDAKVDEIFAKDLYNGIGGDFTDLETEVSLNIKTEILQKTKELVTSNSFTNNAFSEIVVNAWNAYADTTVTGDGNAPDPLLLTPFAVAISEQIVTTTCARLTDANQITECRAKGSADNAVPQTSAADYVIGALTSAVSTGVAAVTGAPTAIVAPALDNAIKEFNGLEGYYTPFDLTVVANHDTFVAFTDTAENADVGVGSIVVVDYLDRKNKIEPIFIDVISGNKELSSIIGEFFGAIFNPSSYNGGSVGSGQTVPKMCGSPAEGNEGLNGVLTPKPPIQVEPQYGSGYVHPDFYVAIKQFIDEYNSSTDSAVVNYRTIVQGNPNFKLKITGGFRNKERQAYFISIYCCEGGPTPCPDKVYDRSANCNPAAAIPGSSQHQSCEAVDFNIEQRCFESYTGDKKIACVNNLKWMVEHAKKYIIPGTNINIKNLNGGVAYDTNGNVVGESNCGYCENWHYSTTGK